MITATGQARSMANGKSLLLAHILWFVAASGSARAQLAGNTQQLCELLNAEATTQAALGEFERFSFAKPADAYPVFEIIAALLADEDRARADRALAALIARAPLLAKDGIYARVNRVLAARAVSATPASTRARIALRAIHQARPEDPVETIRHSLESSDRRAQNVGVGQAHNLLQRGSLSAEQSGRLAVLLFELIDKHPDHTQVWAPLNTIEAPSDTAREALRKWLETRQPDHRTRYPIERGFALWGKWTNYDPAILPTAIRLLDSRDTSYSAASTVVAIASRHEAVRPKLRASYEAAGIETRERFHHGLRQAGANIDPVLDLVLEDFGTNRLAHSAAQTLRAHIQRRPELAERVEPLLERALDSHFALRATSIFVVLEAFPTIPESILPKITARVRQAKGRGGEHLAERAFRFLNGVAPRHPELAKLALELTDARSALVRFPAVCALASAPPSAELTKERILEAIQAAAKTPTTEPPDLPAKADRRADLARAVDLFTGLLKDPDCKDLDRWRTALTDKERVIADGAKGLLQRANRVPPILLDSVLTGISGPQDAMIQARLIVHAESIAHVDRLSFYYRPLTPRLRAELEEQFATSSIEFQVAVCAHLTSRRDHVGHGVQLFRAAGATTLSIHRSLTKWARHEDEEVATAARAALEATPANRHRPAVLRVRTLVRRLSAIERSNDPAEGWTSLLTDPDIELRLAALETVGALLEERELDPTRDGLTASLLSGLGAPASADALGARRADTEFGLRTRAVRALHSAHPNRARFLETLGSRMLRAESRGHRVRLGVLLHSLGGTGIGELPPGLLAAGLRDPLPAVRSLTLAAKGRHQRRRDPEGLVSMLRALADPDQGVRNQALGLARGQLDRMRDPEQRARSFEQALARLGPDWHPQDPLALTQTLGPSAAPFVGRLLARIGPNPIRSVLQRIQTWGPHAHPLWRDVLRQTAPGRPDHVVAAAWQALVGMGAPHDEPSAQAVLASIPPLETLFEGRFSPDAIESALLLVGRSVSRLPEPSAERRNQLDRIADQASGRRIGSGASLEPTVLATRLLLDARTDQDAIANARDEINRWLRVPAMTSAPTLFTLIELALRNRRTASRTRMVKALATRASRLQGASLDHAVRLATEVMTSLGNSPKTVAGVEAEDLGAAAKGLASLCIQAARQSRGSPRLDGAVEALAKLPAAAARAAGDLFLAQQARGAAFAFGVRHHTDGALAPVPDWVLFTHFPEFQLEPLANIGLPAAFQRELIKVALDDPNQRRRSGALRFLARHSDSTATLVLDRWPANRQPELAQAILGAGVEARGFVPWLVEELANNRKRLDDDEFADITRRAGRRNLAPEQMAAVAEHQELTNQRTLLLSALAATGPLGMSHLIRASIAGSDDGMDDLDVGVSAVLRHTRDKNRKHAVTALLSLGDPAPVAHLLVQALGRSDPETNDAVVTALAASSDLPLERSRTGRDPRRLAETGLRNALGSGATTARLAIETLDRFVPDFDSTTYAALSALTLDPDPALRLAVIKAAQRRGANARSLLPTLRAMAADPDDRVRQAAAAAIVAIR